MKTDQDIITIENLSFTYDHRPVLEEVNLTITAGEFTCIVGPNGGGKTTLAKLILGLLSPKTGKVLVFGRTPNRARSRIGYMPQLAQHDPKFPVSVLDVVTMGRLGNGHKFGPYRRDDRAAAQQALADVGLEDLLDRHYASLSGGQKRRLLIARAIACEPELLLLDEPTANLDPKVGIELYELLDKLNKKMTVVVVSHDMALVSHFVQKVVCVNRRVHVHPTSEIEGNVFAELFGADIRLIRHDRHTG